MLKVELLGWKEVARGDPPGVNFINEFSTKTNNELSHYDFTPEWNRLQ